MCATECRQRERSAPSVGTMRGLRVSGPLARQQACSALFVYRSIARRCRWRTPTFGICRHAVAHSHFSVRSFLSSLLLHLGNSYTPPIVADYIARVHTGKRDRLWVPAAQVLFPPERLARVDGVSSRKVYLAVLGTMFDVSKGWGHYGEGWC